MYFVWNGISSIPIIIFIDGDTGRGLGASHQTGWTGLVAKLIELYGLLDAKRVLEVGKKADFVVLSQNILEIDPGEIHNTTILLTYFGGQEVYRSELFGE